MIIVARWRGFAALLGLGFAGFILVKFMFPALVSGTNPMLVGLIGCSAIMFVVLYAAHGFSARTTTALVGTLFGLVTAALLGWGATRWAHLTGVTRRGRLHPRRGRPGPAPHLGGAVRHHRRRARCAQRRHHHPGLGGLGAGRQRPEPARLFSKAMRIGRDHIASTVYTIAFATAGASLPVLLLIAIYNRPLFQVLQTEQFAAELIRTLVGSIGLVLAVPLTTAIGGGGRPASRNAKPPGRGQARPAAAADPGPADADDDGRDTTEADVGDRRQGRASRRP